MRRDFGCVVVDEMADAMMRDSPQLRPIAQGRDGGLFVFGKNPATAQADDVRELVFHGGRELGFHAPACPVKCGKQGVARSG